MTLAEALEADVDDLSKRVLELESGELDLIKRISDLQDQIIKQNDIIIATQKEMVWMMKELSKVEVIPIQNIR